ncbi:uncharacterized protein ACIB01_019136 [Guaruba guarouba]
MEAMGADPALQWELQREWTRVRSPRGHGALPLFPQRRCPPPSARLRLDVSPSPHFPPAPGPRAVPAGGRVYVQLSLSRAPPGLSFRLRLCFVSPRSSPAPPPGPGAPPRPLVVLRGGCGARGAARARPRLFRSFRLPPRFPEPLQFLHCRVRLCREGAGSGNGRRACGSGGCSRRGGGASGSGPAHRPRPGPAHGPALRTVSRPMVVTLGPARGGGTGAPPLPFPPPPPVLRLPPPPPQRDRPRPPPRGPPGPPRGRRCRFLRGLRGGGGAGGGVWSCMGAQLPPGPLRPPTGPALPPRARYGGSKGGNGARLGLNGASMGAQWGG